MNRSVAITICDEYLGVVLVRSYIAAEAAYNSVRISSTRIFDISFANPDSNMIAVLNEDQLVTLWKIGENLMIEKMSQEFKSIGTHLTHIRFNPYDPDEILCFSDTEIFYIKVSISKSMTYMATYSGIEDISFLPKIRDCNF